MALLSISRRRAKSADPTVATSRTSALTGPPTSRERCLWPTQEPRTQVLPVPSSSCVSLWHLIINFTTRFRVTFSRIFRRLPVFHQRGAQRLPRLVLPRLHVTPLWPPRHHAPHNLFFYLYSFFYRFACSHHLRPRKHRVPSHAPQRSDRVHRRVKASRFWQSHLRYGCRHQNFKGWLTRA